MEYFVVTGVGRSPTGDWHEDSLGVFNIDLEDALRLADRHGQNAVVWVAPESKPVLLLCTAFFAS